MFHLHNASDLVTVKYPLFLLKGEIEPFCGCVELSCQVSEESSPRVWSVCGKLFKIFLFLNPGVNSVKLVCRHFGAQFRVVYITCCDPIYIVQPIYVVPAGDDGRFQTPPGDAYNRPEAAVKRIGFAVRLLQTLTAESFYSELGRRHTFLCAEVDKSDTDPSLVPCFVYHTQLTLREICDLSPAEVWSLIACDLLKEFPEQFEKTKWIAFVSCTRYIPQAMSSEGPPVARAHFTLGTGGLALLGTASLHAWPENLDELQRILVNTRDIERMAVLDDTAFRHTMWACFATGLGAVWHELGHCLGLDHSAKGIMNRGCDDVHLCMGFPPPDSFCPHGCRTLPTERSSSIPVELNPPKPLVMALQFHSITQLRSPDRIMNCGPYKVWSPCHSLWHQGGAFWGREQILKLLKSPWIIEAQNKSIV